MGAVNLNARNPVTNAEFTSITGSVLGRLTALAIPRFGPRLLLGRELADNLVFSGQRVLPRVLEQHAYRSAHPDLVSALRALLDK
jgi:NAD dependent epimerase/dehydratase family enzyme